MEGGVQREEGMAIRWEGRHGGPDSAPKIVYTFQIKLLDAVTGWWWVIGLTGELS